MTVFFGGEPTPEQREVLQQQLALRIAFRNDIKHMMQDLSTHQLWILKMMFGSIGRDHQTACEAAMHTEGLLTAYLEMRGMCAGCGYDHLQREMEEGLAQAAPQPVQPTLTEVTQPEPSIHEHQAAMDAYHVSLSPRKGSPDRVVCTGRCNGQMEWPSLDDRMALPPDGCPQCIHKQKWG